MSMEEWGCLRGCRYLLHDRDAKFCQSFSPNSHSKLKKAVASWHNSFVLA